MFATRALRTATPIRSFTTSALRRTEATPAAAAAPQLPAAAAPPQLLSYFVSRTASGELPCYSDSKNGGQRINTLIRRIDGNVEVRSTGYSLACIELTSYVDHYRTFEEI